MRFIHNNIYVIKVGGTFSKSGTFVPPDCDYGKNFPFFIRNQANLLDVRGIFWPKTEVFWTFVDGCNPHNSAISYSFYTLFLL